jgi:hypothetical protein
VCVEYKKRHVLNLVDSDGWPHESGYNYCGPLGFFLFRLGIITSSPLLTPEAFLRVAASSNPALKRDVPAM